MPPINLLRATSSRLPTAMQQQAHRRCVFLPPTCSGECWWWRDLGDNERRHESQLLEPQPPEPQPPRPDWRVVNPAEALAD